jgi:hypothetical protein
MTTAPATPTPEIQPLSEPARIVDTFIAPRKTFTDIRRSAAWWGPLLVTVILAIAFSYAVDAKVGYRKVVDNQIERTPKVAQQLEQLSREDRERQLNVRAKFTKYFLYGFPIVGVIWNLIVAALLFATLRFALNAELPFSGTFAVVMYASLAISVRTIIAIIMLFAGQDPDSFNIQNPAPTSGGFYLSPGGSPFLYSIATSFDLVMIWTLFLTALGLSIVSKKLKLSTAMIVVFGWYALFMLVSAGLAAIAS